MGRLVPPGAVIAAALAAASCTFDPRGIGDDDLRHDGPVQRFDAGAIDAAICTELTARIRVDDLSHDSAAVPATTVLVGDTVALSSTGSCGPGALTYQWQVSPVIGIRDTIAPTDDASTITVYATSPDAYSVTLTVRSAGEVATASVYAFDALGFDRLAGIPTKVHDLDVGDGHLWVAAESGGFRAPLTTLTPVTSILDEVTGAIPVKQAAILWDDGRRALWVGGLDAAPGVWRVAYDAVTPTSARIAYDGVLGGVARTSALSLVTEPGAGTVAASTDKGVAFSDGVTFTSAFVPGGGNVEIGGAAETGVTWALAAGLHGIDDGQVFPLFGGGRPTGLVADLDRAGLWAALDGEGIAHVELVGDGIQLTSFGELNGLPSKQVRDLAIEPGGRFAGDVWAATARGLARWKVDRQVWIVYGNPQGLRGQLDLRTVVVQVAADGTGRAVFAGGKAGAVYSRLP